MKRCNACRRSTETDLRLPDVTVTIRTTRVQISIMSAGSEEFRCGYIAIVGRPNVGKSTLMNCMLGQKISITSPKPQTTRHRILGIKTSDRAQLIFVDTPGLHRAAGRAMNRVLNKAALDAIHDVDIILLLVEAGVWTDQDQYLIDKLHDINVPVILVLNKVDRIKRKDELLAFIRDMSEKMPFAGVVPVSAKSGDNLGQLEQLLTDILPVAPALFSEEQVTDRSERFIAAELIREKLMRRLGQELPYALTVEIEQFTAREKLLDISAIIWVERDGQKAIVIGKQGSGLKAVGKQARLDMENIFGQKVFLRLWVKVKEKWSDDERALRSFGYSDRSL